MKIAIKTKLVANSRNLMRDCGYFEILDRKTGKISFVRKLRGDPYPRFHVYVGKEEADFLLLNMHLDMKKPVYEGVTAHSGEYEGPLVEQEAARIKRLIETAQPPKSAEPTKKSFLGSLFGGGDED